MKIGRKLGLAAVLLGATIAAGTALAGLAAASPSSVIPPPGDGGSGYWYKDYTLPNQFECQVLGGYDVGVVGVDDDFMCLVNNTGGWELWLHHK